MTLTALEIKDKSFGTKFRGYDVEEVDEFLDIVVRDYEDLVRENHEKEAKIRNLEERLTYFDEMKDSLSRMRSICWMELSTRLMRFCVRQLTMLRK